MSAQAVCTEAKLPVPHLQLKLSSWRAIRAAVFMLGAGAVHLTVMPQHFQEYPPFRVFFLLSSLAQAGLAAALLFSPGRLVAIVGAAANLAVQRSCSRLLRQPKSPRPRRHAPCPQKSSRRLQKVF